MLVTTYQYDYVLPYTKRYDFFKRDKQTEERKIDCHCMDENKINSNTNIRKSQYNVEWTGIAPMGRLIQPRIIPTILSNDQLEPMLNEHSLNCFKEQPNRFLKILRTVYPDLYERLKQMPKDELSRRLERDRIYTTYQVDFSNINEYPEGIYKSLKAQDETSKLNASKLLERKEPCAELRAKVIDELTSENASKVSKICEKSYKPLKTSFADSSPLINSGNYSHWRSNMFAKKATFSEYMDTINKIGCVIIKNNIHNHDKCTEKSCRHQLAHACSNLK